MKRNLLIGIIGGAAVGAAASYLMDSENRSTLARGFKNIAGPVLDSFGLNMEEENMHQPVSNLSRGRGRSNASTSRRG